MTVAILYRDELKEYDFGPGHPFRGDRYELFPAISEKATSSGRLLSNTCRLNRRRQKTF